MRLLEHQSKQLLSDFGLPFSEAIVADSAASAREAALYIGGPVVLKAQVPFGGRGKAGAVLFAATPEEAWQAATRILQTELRGVSVEKVTIEARVKFGRELYAGVTWDTTLRSPVALLSAAGGVEVEDAIHLLARKAFDPRTGLRTFEGREMAYEIGITGRTLVAIGATLEKLARAFLESDAVTAEINPLVETEAGVLLGLDAHVEIDDDGAGRQQPRLTPLGEICGAASGRKPTALELEAQRIDSLDHRGVAGRVVEFDGDLGLLIGGGGASLTVFDAVRRHGGRPANYCEVGGNPTEEKVAALTDLLLQKPGVRKMAVIMNVVNNTRADIVARGVLMGVERASLAPAETICLFRIPGSWEEEARQLLAQHGVDALGREISLDACARLAVEKSNALRGAHAA